MTEPTLIAWDSPEQLSAPRCETYTVPTSFVDINYKLLLRDDVSGMNDFTDGLNALRKRLSVPGWRRFVEEDFGRHPIRSLIHEDPFARRAFEKPRGYAGDAPLLDLIYRDVPYGGPLTLLGARLHEWSGDQPACRSVRERRAILAKLIDGVAADRPRARILSVACGHLREALCSRAVRTGAIEEFVALDQDAENVALIERELRHFRITPVRSSIRPLLVNPTMHGRFDFIYSAGLYDYLDDQVAVALTTSMFTALEPGGLLLVVNFAPQLREIGYMEAIMDWRLIYRDEKGVKRFSAGIPRSEVAEQTLFRDSWGNVVYFTIRKGGHHGA
jgi:extracellular factor (EF) 3-hydroxypalmitic acid methyl ester biosynthesis protein